MDSHGLMDPLIAGCPMGDTQEQLFQARLSCEAFFLSNLRISRFLLEQGLHLLHERIGLQEHSRSQPFPYIDPLSLLHESKDHLEAALKEMPYLSCADD